MKYFEGFVPNAPLVEIDAAAARSSGTYAELVEDDVPRYRSFVGGALHKIVYAPWDNPEVPLADFRTRNEGVRGEIVTKPNVDADGRVSWRTWYVTPAGEVERSIEYLLDAEGRFLREDVREPDGRLDRYRVYKYDKYGELLEVVTHGPDGKVLNREHA